MRVALSLETDPNGDGVTPTQTLAALSERLRSTRSIPLALGVPDSEDGSTLMLRVTGARIEGKSEQLDQAFAEAEQRVERLLETLLAQARALEEGGEFAAAAQAYQRTAAWIGDDTGAWLVALLESLANVERAQGRAAAAAALLDRVLALEPERTSALGARVALAQENGEAALAAALLERLAPLLETSAKRVEVLLVAADESLRAARNAIGFASQLMPGSVHLLERLRAVNEGAGLWDAAVSAAVQVAEATADPCQRARALVDAARLCSERAHHTARAVALYEAAIQDDPQVSGAFEAIEAELLRAGDHAGLASAYQRQLERLAAAGILEQQPELLRKLARIQRDHLDASDTAIQTLDRLIQLAPVDVGARMEIATLLEKVGEPTLAMRALEVACVLEPAQVDVYRSLVRLFQRSGDEDRVYCACSALVALGEADLDEQLSFAQYRPEGLLAARSTLDEDAWSQLLPKDHPTALDELAAALEPAALTAMIKVSRPSVPAPRERVDPQESTVTAVRCFSWAARLLDLPEPEIYVDPTQVAGAQIVPQSRVGILLGRPVLSGRSIAELAFLAAHHLAYARPGWRMIALVGAMDEIRALLLAGMAVACPDAPAFASLGAREQEMAALLSTHMDSAACEVVGRAVQRALADGSTFDVLGWLRSVEQTACRAGLLACGDVTVAASVLSVSGASPGGESAADRTRGLLPFCVSQRHSALRHWLGVAAGH